MKMLLEERQQNIYKKFKRNEIKNMLRIKYVNHLMASFSLKYKVSIY
jgi:hypothetical protein